MYRQTVGTELRPAFQSALRAAHAKMQTPDAFRAFLRKVPMAQWNVPSECGALELFISGSFSRVRVTIGEDEVVHVIDWKGNQALVELEIPGWARAYIERWFQIWNEYMTEEYCGFMDDSGNIPAQAAERILDEVTAG